MSAAFEHGTFGFRRTFRCKTPGLVLRGVARSVTTTTVRATVAQQPECRPPRKEEDEARETTL